MLLNTCEAFHSKQFRLVVLIISAEYPPVDRPFMRLNNFDACSCLENATFFSDLKLQLPSGEVELNRHTATLVAQHIDSVAQEIISRPRWNGHIFQRRTQITKDYFDDLFMRSICFSVALGNLDKEEWKGFVKPEPSWKEPGGLYTGRFLRTVDSDVALPFLNYNAKQTTVKKRHYNLAYILIVHEEFENVRALIEALADPTAFIYIHVDLEASDKFRKSITELVAGRPHILLMPNPFAVAWAHVSLLWTEIRAYFDLLDLIEFDYVINLSGSDYALKSARAIYKDLERRRGSNWLWWLDDKPDQIQWRFQDMYHCQPPWLDKTDSPTRCVFDIGSKMGLRSWDGLRELYPYRWKSSQWKIFHHSTIEHLRQSEGGKLLMMWSENMWVPDEMIIPTWLNSSPFVNQTFRDPKRLIRWTPWEHPYHWKGKDESLIMEWQQHFYFIRKVNVTGDPRLKQILDRIRERDEMSEDLVVFYRDGITPVD
jgi:hypothetical protein